MFESLSTVPVSVAVPVYSVAIYMALYVPFVVYRGARRLDFTPVSARLLAYKVAGVLWGWFAVAALLTLSGLFSDGPGFRIPWMGLWFFGVIIAGTVGTRRWTDLYRVLANRQTLAELLLCQTVRWLGAMFFTLHAAHQLPGFFSYPAGWGDIFVGITCTVTVIVLATTRNNAIPIIWTLLGLLDFVGAVGTSLLSMQSIGVVHTDPSSFQMTHLPMSLFPAYMVSFSIVLHLVTLLLLTGPLSNRRQAPDTITVNATAGGAVR